MPKLPFSSDSRMLQLTWLFYTQGWYQVYTSYYTHLDGTKVPRGKARCSLSMIMQLPHTTDLFLPPSLWKRVLGTSKTQFLFIEMVTWDSWQVILFWSDEGTQRWWLLLNLPFVSTTPPQTITATSVCPPPATLSEDSWTCSSDFFQWHSNSVFFSVVRLLKNGF